MADHLGKVAAAVITPTAAIVAEHAVDEDAEPHRKLHKRPEKPKTCSETSKSKIGMKTGKKVEKRSTSPGIKSRCPCSIEGCMRTFKSASSLRNHLNGHKGKPHECQLMPCSAKFITKSELFRHVRYVHTEEKHHKCPEENCPYQCVEASKMRRHSLSHTVSYVVHVRGERPLKCEACGYTCTEMFKLKRHSFIHTGEKPYKCDICHMKFNQSSSMKSHRLLHDMNTKPVFQCPLCPRTCSRKPNLRVHVRRLHQSDKPIVCVKCSKSFPDSYSYNVHGKTESGCLVKENDQQLRLARKMET